MNELFVAHRAKLTALVSETVAKLEDVPDDRIHDFWPEDGRLTEEGMVWEYTDYEPTGQLTVHYYPNMPVRDIPPYLVEVYHQYPDDPGIAERIGSILYSHFGEGGLSKKVWHEVLARWDEPIPDLLRREPGGRCGYDIERAGRFYSAWRLGHMLYHRYKLDRELERARDVAPTVAKMSRAIVEALTSCDTLRDQDRYLLRDATELYEVSLSLMEDR